MFRMLLCFAFCLFVMRAYASPRPTGAPEQDTASERLDPVAPSDDSTRRGQQIEDAVNQSNPQKIQTEAQREANTYSSEVTALAKEIAVKRAERLSWIYSPSQTDPVWIGFGIYYGNTWETRQACDKDRACLPHMGVNYGAELWLNPFASLDLVGRIGGATQIADGFSARHGLDVTALVRWRFVGMVPIGIGWRMTGLPYAQTEQDGRPSDATTYTHRVHVEGGVRIRGASVVVSATMGLPSVLGIKSTDDAVNAFSAHVGLMLITPALIGW